MPGVVLLVVAVVVNYVGHKTGWWKTACTHTREHVPMPMAVSGLLGLFGWLLPHLVRGYKKR